MGIANPHFENDTLDRNSSPWIVLPGDRVMCMRADCSRQRCEPAHDNEQSVSHGPISLVEVAVVLWWGGSEVRACEVEGAEGPVFQHPPPTSPARRTPSSVR